MSVTFRAVRRESSRKGYVSFTFGWSIPSHTFIKITEGASRMLACKDHWWNHEFRQSTIENLSAFASGFEKLDMQSGKQNSALTDGRTFDFSRMKGVWKSPARLIECTLHVSITIIEFKNVRRKRRVEENSKL